MNNYIINFAIYTFAMIGFIIVTLLVYKKAMYTEQNQKCKDFLKVESAMKLSASKSIYVIKAGCERFLVAGDAANTTMLAKLDENNTIPESIIEQSNMDKSQENPYMKKIAQLINRG